MLVQLPNLRAGRARRLLLSIYVDGTRRMATTPTGLAGRLVLLTPLPHELFETFSPNVLVDDAFSLRAYGVDADVYHSGGHTPGSLSVFVPASGEVTDADLLAGGIGVGSICCHGHVIEPPFCEDRHGVVKAESTLLQLDGLRRFHVCHGGPLKPLDVETSIRRMARSLPRP